jgi:hypothetical protein
MPRGFAENTSTHTRHRRAAQTARLSFDVDRLLGRSEIMPHGIKKSRGKCILTYAARQKLLRLDAPLYAGHSTRPHPSKSQTITMLRLNLSDVSFTETATIVEITKIVFPSRLTIYRFYISSWPYIYNNKYRKRYNLLTFNKNKNISIHF